MASISTRRGDGGNTGLGGGARVSKGDLRVEAYGSIDELKSFIGAARAICADTQLCELVLSIQRELFAVGSAVSTKPGARREVPHIPKAMVEQLDAAVEELEREPNLRKDWTIPGSHPSAAAFDVARTVARRAERNVVRLVSAGEKLQPTVLEYLNRLSDVLWLCARVLEARAGIDARLRDERHPGPPWSRAW